MERENIERTILENLSTMEIIHLMTELGGKLMVREEAMRGPSWSDKCTCSDIHVGEEVSGIKNGFIQKRPGPVLRMHIDLYFNREVINGSQEKS